MARRHSIPQAVARFRFLFDEAAERLPVDLNAIFAQHAKLGRLDSGATYKEVARAVEARAAAAVAGSLEAIGRATDKPGRQREKLVEALRPVLADQWKRLDLIAWTKLEKGGRDRALFQRLLDEAWPRILSEVDQYGLGWTDPAATPWKERHPLLHDVLVAVISGLIGLAIGSLILPNIDVSNVLEGGSQQ